MWVNKMKEGYGQIEDGVKVVHRDDYNYDEVVEEIKTTVAAYSNFSPEELELARAQAEKLSKKALWSEFIKYYWMAYDLALRKAEERAK